MLIFRFILLFGGPSRIGLHTLIFRKHIIFLKCCISAALLYTRCLERTVVATE